MKQRISVEIRDAAQIRILKGSNYWIAIPALPIGNCMA
ncbi:hypothetical protein BF49_0357 [Bradyrhizobium sp.]|nr:hypothetical protein BF49_0357 [Bradyrhizobium sp.]